MNEGQLMFLLALVFHIRSRQGAERAVLLEIDAQGSEGLLGLTKLQAECIRDMRKMGSGDDEDQVAENKSQSMKIKRRRAPCYVLMTVVAKSKLSNEAVRLLKSRHLYVLAPQACCQMGLESILNCLYSAWCKNWNKCFPLRWELREASEIFKPPSLLCRGFVTHQNLHLVCAWILHKKEQ